MTPGPSEEAAVAPPLHGYRGEPAPTPPAGRCGGLTVAISRQAGARGGTIARKLGELLQWQVFDRERIEYLIHDETARLQLESELEPEHKLWRDNHYQRFVDTVGRECTDLKPLAEVVLTLAARGEVVIVGRAAGFLLPAATTLHVRIVAPRADRVAWLAQWLRLSYHDAEQEVLARDARRQRFLKPFLDGLETETVAYDAVLNAGRLGVEAAAQIIGWMVRTHQAIHAWDPPSESPSSHDAVW